MMNTADLSAMDDDSDSSMDVSHELNHPFAETTHHQALQSGIEALGMNTEPLIPEGQIDIQRVRGSKGRNSFRSAADAPPLPLLGKVHPQTFATRKSMYDLDEIENSQEIAQLCGMYSRVYQCRQTRCKYMDQSLQRESLNPKNQKGWKVYPAPPESTEYRTTNDDVVEFDLSELPIPNDKRSEVFTLNGDHVYVVFEDNAHLIDNIPLAPIPSYQDYIEDFMSLSRISSDGPLKTFAYRRLQYLEAQWSLYTLLNSFDEVLKSKRIPHRDFYNVRKVDTHVHHSAAMTQKHLLRFIKSKLRKSPDEVVIYRDEKHLTLAQVFESLGLSAYDLNIDTLDMHAHSDSFHRFDKFNLKYNPVGESRLREIFLKTDNHIQGKYLAEITREIFSDLNHAKYQKAEYRISIYGRSQDEWSKLAAWVVDHKLFNDNVRWLIQVPRLYNIYKSSRIVKNFGEILTNIFKPLFDITLDPSKDPKLHIFLQRVVGFDSVDDESKRETNLTSSLPPPQQWVSEDNPPYGYWLYYLYANMATLNQFRARRKFNTFVLRPHAGEAGDPEHLICAYLTSYGISHGILLRKLPLVQFLFYLDQIGIAMSPISNNALFLAYEKNPFLSYFKRGLSVSLSTDDPLQFSFTREPLIEEYSIAIQIYKLTPVDSRELALMSIKQSGFEDEIKSYWGYDMHTGEVNMEKTNIPLSRLAYREESLSHEIGLINKFAVLNRS